jgi:hypothetical protein
MAEEQDKQQDIPKEQRRRTWGSNNDTVLGRDISAQEMRSRQRTNEAAKRERMAAAAKQARDAMWHDGGDAEMRKNDPHESIVDAAIAQAGRGKDILNPERARALALGYTREADGSYIRIKSKQERAAEQDNSPSLFGYRFASTEIDEPDEYLGEYADDEEEEF